MTGIEPTFLRAPSVVKAGRGAVATLGETVKAYSGSGPVLVCTDSYLASAAPGKAVEASLREAGSTSSSSP